MFLNNYLTKPIFAIIIHVVLGITTRYIPQITASYFLLIVIIGCIDIVRSKDNSSVTALYLFYVVSFEIIYRTGKFYFFWDLGKYSCILLAVSGLLVKRRPSKLTLPFLFFTILLIPGIIVSLIYGNSNVTYLRELITYHISGPIALGIMGMYFYKRKLLQRQIQSILKLAILPSVSIVIFLFLGPKISEIDFISTSNYETSGGFGPNQVSTMIGWGVLLLIYALLTKNALTINRLTDIGLLLLLIFRGLLTFSRGGMIASFTASIASLFIVFFLSPSYRKNFGKIGIRLVFAICILIPVVFFVNKLTGDFLFYRYQGKTTNEVITGQISNQAFLSGRGEILSSELKAFSEYPFWGLGVGRGTIYREEIYGESYSSHTEQTRLLGEHGLIGIIILFVYFIYLPIAFIKRLKYGENKHWSIQLYLLAMLTMFHASMRLAMPALAFAVIFIIIVPDNFEKNIIHRKSTFKARLFADHY